MADGDEGIGYKVFGTEPYIQVTDLVKAVREKGDALTIANWLADLRRRMIEDAAVSEQVLIYKLELYRLFPSRRVVFSWRGFLSPSMGYMYDPTGHALVVSVQSAAVYFRQASRMQLSTADFIALWESTYQERLAAGQEEWNRSHSLAQIITYNVPVFKPVVLPIWVDNLPTYAKRPTTTNYTMAWFNGPRHGQLIFSEYFAPSPLDVHNLLTYYDWKPVTTPANVQSMYWHAAMTQISS
jgi:hypothetical protein